MEQISYFHKGISTDLDYSKMDNQGFLLPTTNIQIINKDGQGLIITPTKGNKKTFELSPGFQWIGAAEYNSIAYIISHNPATGQGEIGSFPSPNGNGFNDSYSPLRNLSGVANDFMRSNVFNFSLDNPVGREAIALIDYDNTVNIVFTDGVNELRFVNSGFDQQGVFKPDRAYEIGTLDASIKLIKSNPDKQRIVFKRQSVGGKLGYGNYFFFYRYVTASNNTTEFVAESEPILINRTEQNNQFLFTSGWDEESNKKLSFELSNLDNAYSYVQFAFIRYYASEAGFPINEIKLVDNFYPITGDKIDITITGYETFIPLDISAILKPVNRENVVKSIVAHDRRIWGGNWKAEPINYDALREYSLNIRLSANDEDTIASDELLTFYSNPENIRKAGYIRGESYIAGVSFELNNGFETERFPVKGIDAYNLSCSSIINSHELGQGINNKGIIRMPNNFMSPFIVNTSGGIEGSILKLVFDMSLANDWIENQTSLNIEWIKENVRSVKFLRAERIPNRLYQGYVFNVAGRSIRTLPLDPTEALNNNASIPDFFTLAESLNIQDRYKYNIPSTQNTIPLGNTFTGYFNTNNNSDENKTKAVFSSDYIFGDKLIVDASEYSLISNFNFYFDRETSSRIIPSVTKIKPIAYGPIIKQKKVYDNVQLENVYSLNNWITPQNKTRLLNLVNKVDDPINEENKDNALFWFQMDNGTVIGSNRSILSAPYFGLKNENTDGFSIGDIVNVYRENPELIDYSITDIYLSELNFNYKQVTTYEHPILPSSNSLDAINCFQGDCFVQKTIIKARSWYPSKTIGIVGGESKEVGASVSARGVGNDVLGNPASIKYAHGILLEMISENEINAALRIKNQGETDYFPANESDVDIESTFTLSREYWAVWPYSTDVKWDEVTVGTGIESYLLNRANSVTVSLKTYLSENPQIPKGIDHFKNRIRYTGQQEPNYPIMSYRMWDYNSKQDYDEKHGETVKLEIVQSRLVSIQESSITLHNTNVEETVPSSSGEMVIGTRSILSPYSYQIAQFGTKHPLSVIKARSGVYGWDWDNSVIWRIIQGERGMMVARALSSETMIERHLKDLHDKRNLSFGTLLQNKIIVDKRDSTIVQEGLFSYYNPNTSEICFYLAVDGTGETLRFSEKFNEFVGTFDYPTIGGFSLDTDYYSLPLEHNNPGVYIHEKGLPATYYGKPYKPVFSFIVNGIMGDKNLFYLDKLFKSLEIEAPYHNGIPAIEKVEFITSFQKTENNPFYDEESFWLLPEYLMSKWAFTINEAESGEGQFESESNINGKWLKVIVTLKPNTDTFVKNIITKFITSNS